MNKSENTGTACTVTPSCVEFLDVYYSLQTDSGGDWQNEKLRGKNIMKKTFYDIQGLYNNVYEIFGRANNGLPFNTAAVDICFTFSFQTIMCVWVLYFLVISSLHCWMAVFALDGFCPLDDAPDMCYYIGTTS